MHNRLAQLACLAVACASACGGRVAVVGGSSGTGGAIAMGRAGASNAGGTGGEAAAGATSTGSAGNAGNVGNAGTSSAAGSSAVTHRAGQLKDYLGDPSYPDDFWRPAPSGVVDPKPLERALTQIEQSGWEIHSLLIVFNGLLVFEHYGWSTGTNPAVPNETPHQITPNERQLQFSATKSFVSALVGIAIDEGALRGVDQHAVDFFPDYASLNPSPDKSSITLADLLTMRSGLQFTEGEQGTFGAPDPARAMLSRMVVDLPVGQVWNYSSGGSDIITEVLRVATGRTPLDYANAKLFGPIGIVNPPWDAGRTGTQYGGFGLSLTAREMARFGELFLDSGRWAGQQVVPESWTDESTLARCPTAWGRHYGYLWWVPDLPGFFNALGAFGQEIFVNRTQSVVVVFTANLPSEQADTIFENLIRDDILPALPQPVE